LRELEDDTVVARAHDGDVRPARSGRPGESPQAEERGAPKLAAYPGSPFTACSGHFSRMLLARAACGPLAKVCK
jgi:hypothetical protein